MERDALDGLIKRQTQVIENILRELANAQAGRGNRLLQPAGPETDADIVARISKDLAIATDSLGASIALRRKVA